MSRWILLACLAAPLCAQQASLRVEVTDPSGAVIPNPIVAVESESQEVTQEATGSELGVAVFSVPHGRYTVRASFPGFETKTMVVEVAKPEVELALELGIGPITTFVHLGEGLTVEDPFGTERVRSKELAEAPSTDLVEALSDVPGVNVLRRGGTNFEPVVYGLRETQVAMVVDGTRTFAAGPARMDSELSHVEPGYVDSVRVVSGPYALTEGAGAFAAIVVDTPPAVLNLGGRTSMGYGSNGAGRFARQRIYGGNQLVRFSLRAAGNKGNDYRAGESGGAGELTVPGDYSNHQFGGKLRVTPRMHHELTLGALYDEQTGIDYPGRILNAQHFLQRGFNGGYLYLRGPILFKAGLYLNKKSHRMRNDEKPTARDMPGRTPPFALRVDLPTEADTLGGAASVEFAPNPDWTFKTGFDFYNLDQDAQRFVARRSNGFLIFSDAVWPNVAINDQGFYGQLTRRFNRGEIAAALRFDTVQADAGRPSDFFLTNTAGDLDQSEFNTSFSVSGRYSLFEGVSLGGGFGRVMRTASGLERYSDRFPSTKFQVAAEFVGDPAIRPEAAWQGDANLEVKRGGMTLNGGVFYRRIDDYITVAPDSSLTKRLPLSPNTVFRYLNGDHANFRGYQFGVRYRFAGLAELSVQGAKTIADDIEESTPLIGRNEPVVGIAPYEMTSTLRVYDRSSRFWGEYSMRNVWDQQRVAASRLETPSPGFATHDLRFGAELPYAVTLHAGVENLFDKRFFEHLNSLNPFTRQRIPEPGRNIYVGLTKTW